MQVDQIFVKQQQQKTKKSVLLKLLLDNFNENEL